MQNKNKSLSRESAIVLRILCTLLKALKDLSHVAEETGKVKHKRYNL